MSLAKFSRTFPSHAFGVLFLGSVLGELSAALLGISQTLVNTAVLGAALFLLIPYLLELLRGIHSRTLLAAVAVAGWIVGVYLIYGQRSISGTKRLGVLLFHIVLYLAAYRSFSKDILHIRVLWKWLLAASTVFVLLSNLLQGGLVPAFINPEIRYYGVSGPNRLGLLAAYGAIACTLLFGKSNRLLGSWLLVGLFGFFTLNLWASGSRAAMLTLLIYLAVIHYKQVLRYGYVMAVIPAALVGGVAWLVATGQIGYLHQFLRIDEGTGIRFRSMLWGYETIVENNFMPHGFRSITEAPGNLILDSSYIWLSIEGGLFGLLLLLSVIFISIYGGLKVNEKKDDKKIYSDEVLGCTALLTAVAVHATFENNLLVGLRSDTIIFLIVSPYILNRYTKK